MPTENENMPVVPETPAEEKTATSIFLSEVQAKLKDLNEPIKDKLVKTLVDRKVDECVDLLDKGVKKRLELGQALKKIKPDTKQYDGTSDKPVVEIYSETKFNELKKAKEQVAKMEKALELAFGGDYTKLKEALNAGSGGDKSENKKQE